MVVLIKHYWPGGEVNYFSPKGQVLNELKCAVLGRECCLLWAFFLHKWFWKTLGIDLQVAVALLLALVLQDSGWCAVIVWRINYSEKLSPVKSWNVLTSRHILTEICKLRGQLTKPVTNGVFCFLRTFVTQIPVTLILELVPCGICCLLTVTIFLYFSHTWNLM